MNSARSSGPERIIQSVARVVANVAPETEDRWEPRFCGVLAEACQKGEERLRGEGYTEEHIQRQVDCVRGHLFAAMDRLCESPIENVLLATLCFLPVRNFVTYPIPIYDLTRKDPLPASDIVIIPQFPFARYRFDFLVVARTVEGPQKWLAVECDGNDYHHETKNQHIRDANRDLLVNQLGFETLRYTGKQIWKDPFACAGEVAGAMDHWKSRPQGAA